MTSTRNLSVVAILLLAASVGAFGWYDCGHETIAAIAFADLTPTARLSAIGLLKQHPRYEKDLLAGKPAEMDPDRYAFMVAATWPEMVRGPNHPMRFVANHPAWHYIDIPYVQEGFSPPGNATRGGYSAGRASRCRRGVAEDVVRVERPGDCSCREGDCALLGF